MFEQSIATEPHEVSYQKLGNLLVMQEDIPAALHTYMCALELTPKNSDTLTQIGLLHLRQGMAMHGACKLLLFQLGHDNSGCASRCLRSARSGQSFVSLQRAH
jgi:hypothetical protein